MMVDPFWEGAQRFLWEEEPEIVIFDFFRLLFFEEPREWNSWPVTVMWIRDGYIRFKKF